MVPGANLDASSLRITPANTESRQADTLPATLLAVSIGIAVTLCVYGYQFGQSNHTVYLLAALQESDPKLLAHDWFTAGTFQYHAVFGEAARLLIAMHALEPGFLIGYLALVIAFHVGWLRLVKLFGGSGATYLVSVPLYYLSAGGTALGMYQFFQDSSFLPSNIANVLLLWAIVLWIDRRGIGSGTCIGLAGIFHLNHAIIGAGLWIALIVWDALAAARRRTQTTGAARRAILPLRDRRFWIATCAALLPCLANVVYAIALRPHSSQPMPLPEFVDLYVRFRHPHHYDPRSWPIALWISFFWPIAPAIAALAVLRRTTSPAIRAHLLDAARIFVIFAALLVIALLGAGFWFISESLVQMSLYRFSIYVQLFACIGAALLLCDCCGLTRTAIAFFAIAGILCIVCAMQTSVLASVVPPHMVQTVETFIRQKRGAIVLFGGLLWAPAVYVIVGAGRQARPRAIAQAASIGMIVLLMVIGWPRWMGLTQILQKPDPRYLELCAWIRQNTPTDAIFLVPPGESGFRYDARRAIVVNFKGVPQFSGEIAEWRTRLQSVLGIDDLLALPRGFDKTGPAMNRIYSDRSADELIAVAHKFHAGYLVTTHPYDDRGLKLIRNVGGEYLLYAVVR